MLKFKLRCYTFNASVRRPIERQGRLSLMPRGGLERGGDELPARGRFAALERGEDEGRSSRVPMGALERSGDRPAGPSGVRMGRMLGFFWVLSFLPDWKEAVGLCGPGCLTYVRVCQGDLSTAIRVPLITVPDSSITEYQSCRVFIKLSKLVKYTFIWILELRLCQFFLSCSAVAVRFSEYDSSGFSPC